MKRILVATLIGLLALSVVAFAGPYFGWDQFLIPDDGHVVPTGRVIVGGVLSFGEVIEYDCPKENPCGGIQQFTEIGVCIDLYAGLNDVWVVPWSPFFGIDIEANFGYVSFELGSEIGFDDSWGGFPITSGDIQYWDSRAAFVIDVSTWFEISLGTTFDLDGSSFGFNPFVSFWIGDQACK